MPPSQAYKRSWKNLLLNKRYQLRFTLFMVGIAAVLMAGLGWWVMRVANDETRVAMAHFLGDACPQVPELGDSTGAAPTPAPVQLDEPPTPGGSAAAPAAPTPAPAPAPAPSSVDPADIAHHNAAEAIAHVQNLWCVQREPCKPESTQPLVIKAPRCDAWVKEKLADPAYVEALRNATISIVRCEGGQTFTVADAPEPEHHITVQIDESSITLTEPPPSVPKDLADTIVQHWTCEMERSGSLDSLEHRRQLILWVLVGTGIVLTFGLAIYGIKMTHKVAGPLFKVSLYLAKMRDGRFDKVYNLRKGDQLVEFYEHFKHAHAGVVALEREDIDQLKAVIEAAKAAGLGDHEAVAKLERTLARKEKSLE